ncbi:MAG: hypothetical protein K8E24_014470 [Methanobacterium paludis]|nr:hypothetical protein [Methanobacterium paludis]
MYSIEQEIVWVDQIKRLNPGAVYKLKFISSISVLEASLSGGIVRYYVNQDNSLVPFYWSSREWLNEGVS